MDAAELEHRFTFHPPADEERRMDHESIRLAGLKAAQLVDAKVPDGREKSLALTKLEEAVFWANAGLARSAVEPARSN